VRRSEWLTQGGADDGPLPTELENLSL
jgi:hypothetical protein